MARYIDADVFKEYVNSMSTHLLNGWSALGVLAAIDKQTTVDVAVDAHENALAWPGYGKHKVWILQEA